MIWCIIIWWMMIHQYLICQRFSHQMIICFTVIAQWNNKWLVLDKCRTNNSTSWERIIPNRRLNHQFRLERIATKCLLTNQKIIQMKNHKPWLMKVEIMILMLLFLHLSHKMIAVLKVLLKNPFRRLIQLNHLCKNKLLADSNLCKSKLQKCNSLVIKFTLNSTSRKAWKSTSSSHYLTKSLFKLKSSIAQIPKNLISTFQGQSAYQMIDCS